MANALVTVEAVEARTQLRRFRDVPYLLLGDDDRWRPSVHAYEQWRLDATRHPYFRRGDAAYFLARRGGRPAGRIAAHRATPGADDGWFGFFDAPDDQGVVDELLDAAAEWLRAEGAAHMTGPVSWTPDEEYGVLVHGHDQRSITGRTWRPPWYAASLARAGLEPAGERATYRVETARLAGDAPPPADVEPPPHAGGFADPALVLADAAAVPDVSATLATASMRSAWRVAKQARRRGFDTAVCVRCDGDPAVAVPRLSHAAAAAEYRWLVAPWAPDDRPPETVHRVYTRTL